VTSKRQGVESQNTEKIKTKPDATKIQLLGHRKHWKIVPCHPCCTVTLRMVTRTERGTEDSSFAAMETRANEILWATQGHEHQGRAVYGMGFPGLL